MCSGAHEIIPMVDVELDMVCKASGQQARGTPGSYGVLDRTLEGLVFGPGQDHKRLSGHLRGIVGYCAAGFLMFCVLGFLARRP